MQNSELIPFSDPQDVCPIGFCPRCGGELYPPSGECDLCGGEENDTF